MAKNPAERYYPATDLAAEARAALNTPTPSVHPTAPPPATAARTWSTQPTVGPAAPTSAGPWTPPPPGMHSPPTPPTAYSQPSFPPLNPAAATSVKRRSGARRWLTIGVIGAVVLGTVVSAIVAATQAPAAQHAKDFEVSSIAVRGRVADLAIDPAKHALYTGNLDGDTEIIDTNTRAVTGTIPFGNGVQGVVFDPNANVLYGENFNDRIVKVVDIAKKAVIATIPAPDGPNGLDLGTSLLYVLNVNANYITVIDKRTRTEVAEIPTGHFATAITADLSGGITLQLLLIAQDEATTETGSVLVADAEPKIVSTIPLGQPATSIVFDRNKYNESQTIYVAN